MRRKLNNSTGAASAPAPAPQAAAQRRPESGAAVQAPPAAEVALPEGLDGAKYRRLAACADGPELVRQALQDKPLMEAFLKADAALGLHPERLEQRESAPGDEPEQEEAQLPEEE